MIVFAFLALYLACFALVSAVVWQDRHRGASPMPPPAREPHRTHTPTWVFRTHV